MQTTAARRPARPREAATRGGLGLGRVAGIRIRVDASWVIIAVLLLVSLTGQFASAHPAASRLQHGSAAVVASALFFASLLLHELSHSVVARRRGIEVEGITLFIFGGVSQLKEEAKRPEDELMIALVGPLMSVALGGLFLAAAALAGAGTLTASVLAWLGYTNLALAGFNLVPGFPLDGGRVLRAVIWGVTGNPGMATRLAAAGGTLVAFSFMLLGAALALGLGLVLNGLWLAFIGWFLLSAAQSSRQMEIVRDRLSRLQVRQAMRTECARISPDESVASLVEDRILATGQRCFLVMAGAELQGLVTLHELKGLPRDEWSATRVGDVMAPAEQLKRAAPDDTLLSAFEAMDRLSVNQLPVVEDGVLLGILTREDLLHLLSVHLELGDSPAGGAVTRRSSTPRSGSRRRSG